MEQNKSRPGFDFSVFWHNFWRTFPHLFWIPLLLFILAAGYRYYTVRRSYSPVYETFAVYRVKANQSSSIDLSSHGYYVDSSAASKLAVSYPYVMSSDQCRSLMQERYGRTTLPSTVSCRAEATMLIMTSRGSSPQAADDGLHMAAEVFPEAGKQILGNFMLEVFDEAPIPDKPTNPPSFVSGAVRQGLLGLVAGLAIIAFFSLLRKTVHNSEDLRELLNVPCLGLLPEVHFKARSKLNRTVLMTNPHLSESYIEAVRSVRFQLLKELEHQRAKVIMVSSTIPGEGKSTISANLALALAEQGHRVTLVDCDLRRQNLKDLFGIKEPTRGLVELIAEQDNDLESALIPIEGYSLQLLSGDKVAQQPQNFLASPRLQSIINSLRQYADYVIVDTPPSGLLSDAASLSQWADGVVYVIRQDYVTRSAVLDSAGMLSGMDIRFIGCVLNQAVRSTSASGYGYSGKKGYGYGYGYGYGKHYGKTREKDKPEEESYQK